MCLTSHPQFRIYRDYHFYSDCRRVICADFSREKSRCVIRMSEMSKRYTSSPSMIDKQYGVIPIALTHRLNSPISLFSACFEAFLHFFSFFHEGALSCLNLSMHEHNRQFDKAIVRIGRKKAIEKEQAGMKSYFTALKIEM